jgi:radical SAM protein with 4Fe4S-binding SPASM domain
MNSDLIKRKGQYFLEGTEFFSSLFVRFSNPRIIFFETLNQLFRRARIPYALKLTTVGIETNNTCNLRCLHCVTNREMKREKGYMKFDTFARIIDFNPEIKRVYLTNWGEPLIHPKIIDMVRYANIRRKQTAITTNGTTLDLSLSRELLDSGLDIIKFSVDGNRETFQKLRGFSYERVEANILKFIKLRNKMKKKTWVEVSMLVTDETIPEISSFLKKWKKHADFVNLQPKFFTIKRKTYSLCRDLWRILVILWDGRVIPCCVDFDGELVIGDARKENLQRLFKSQAMKGFRKRHIKNDLPRLCKSCSNYYSDYHISRKNIPLKS